MFNDFGIIEQFLSDPINEELKEYYYDTANELNQIISIKRDKFDAFEELFVHIYQLICDGENKLKGSKRHVTTFLHYMYITCEIGDK
ncbi:ABC-three component system protein [Marinifilum fragile]|uniref:ABC-three component system protein n=1 Tax=Marinifilum fragile TaxID=570161 RepID=UPI0038B2A54E